MRARFLSVALVMFVTSAAISAQGVSGDGSAYPKSYSIEVGTGMEPVQMMFISVRPVRQELAQFGQDIDRKGEFYPVLSLTGVMRSGRKTEFTLTAGASWYHHKVIQYSVFGTDPEGKPRYDLSDGSPAGWKDSIPTYSLTLQWRHLWNPDNAFNVYTALGAGLVGGRSSSLLPLPCLTPVAFRYGGKHFYAFTELTLGPIATLVHGGLGWHF